VPTIKLPADPSLENLRNQARALQRAVRAGDPDALARVRARHRAGVPEDAGAFPLAVAQLVLAREYGFASWPRLKHHLDVVTRHRRDLDLRERTDPAEEFCRLACLAYSGDDGPDRWAAARRLVEERPDLTRENIWAAAAAADLDATRRLLAAEPGAARRHGGPYDLTPLFYLAYSRAGGPADRVLATARLLLDAGADPDDGCLWKGLAPPFTVLTGVFGEGEDGPGRQPRHPQSLALARLLLEAGADPNDGQTLYNRMFRADDDHLELLFAYGLGTGDGGPWRARLGDALDSPAAMVRGQLGWAVGHGFTNRVRLLVDHGVDVRSPIRRDGRTPIDVAVRGGHTAIVELLAEAGAGRPEISGVDALVAACLAADRATAARLAGESGLLARTREERPALVVEAAEGRRVEALALLAELGFDLDAQLDAELNARLVLGVSGGTALHWAAWRGDVDLARRLLELGADPGVRDTKFAMTPLEWARHASQDAMAAFLAPEAEG
jgi:Ankyrin repeats (many copies)